MPNTVLYVKLSDCPMPKAEDCLIILHKEQYEAYILLKTLQFKCPKVTRKSPIITQ
jgi:hypothetical protein